MATIAACFMVRNDIGLLNAMLPRALESVKFLVDQIVIVHTRLPGDKKDNVKHLATKYKADLYYHPWENDFSKHRNQTLEYSNCDWNLVIDSDEELLEEDIRPVDFKLKLDRLPKYIDGLVAKVRDIQKGAASSSFVQPRILRNHVRYNGYVHNTISSKYVLSPTDINMKHYGYGIGKKKMDMKYDRTYSLLKKLRKETPEDPKVYFHMVQMYHSKDKLNAMFHSGIKCLQLLEKCNWDTSNMGMYQTIYYYLGYVCLGAEQIDIGIKFIEQGLGLVPNDIDLLFALATAGSIREDPEMVLKGTKGYLAARRHYKNNPYMYGPKTVFTANKEARLKMIRWRRAASAQIRDDCNPVSDSLGNGG